MNEWLEIPGWFDYEDLYALAVEDAPSRAAFLEIGCWMGRSTCFLAEAVVKSGKDISITVIDTFRGTSGDEIQKPLIPEGGSFRGKFEANMRKAGVLSLIEIIEADSAVAYRQLKDRSFDFIFIDGDHSYEAVRRDILNYRSKVRPGGMLAGHDYAHSAEVRRAVDELLGPCPASIACWARIIL